MREETDDPTNDLRDRAPGASPYGVVVVDDRLCVRLLHAPPGGPLDVEGSGDRLDRPVEAVLGAAAAGTLVPLIRRALAGRAGAVDLPGGRRLRVVDFAPADGGGAGRCALLVVRDVTAERETRRAAARWELAFRHTGRGVTLTDPATEVILAANPAFADMHGGSPEDFVGLPLSAVFTPESAARIPAMAQVAARDGHVRYTGEHVRRDGSSFPVDTEVVAARGDDGRVLHRLAFYTDLTDLRDREHREREARERFERSFADAPIGMALLDLEGRWLRVNRALIEMLGYREADLLSRTFRDITHPEDLDTDLAAAERLQAGEVDRYTLEKRYLTAGDEPLWVLLSVSTVRDGTGRPLHVVAHIVDIHERKRMEERLHHLADHDDLTGLWNRRRFGEELARQVRRCRRTREGAALVAFDLDGFKEVNDTHGHKAGDELIIHVARTVRGRLRATDAFARLGGDEFAVLLVDVRAAGARRLADDLCALVAGSPMPWGDGAVHTSLSAGLVMLDRVGVPDGDPMLAADAALYAAKATGRNRVVTHGDDDCRAPADRG